MLKVQSEEQQDNNKYHLHLILLTVIWVKPQQQLPYLNKQKVKR